MAKRIDYEQVRLMADTGFCKKQIASRLGCSAKQITRIAKDKNLVFEKQAKEDINTNTEYFLWSLFYTVIDRSYSKTARRFGVSRQAIYERLNLNQ